MGAGQAELDGATVGVNSSVGDVTTGAVGTPWLVPSLPNGAAPHPVRTRLAITTPHFRMR